MARFYRGFDWRFLVTDLESVVLTNLERSLTAAQVTVALNDPAQAKLTVPSDDPVVNIPHTDGNPTVSYNDRLVYGFRREGGDPPWRCRFAGVLMQIEDAVTEEQPYSPLTAYDPWQYLFHRTVTNGTSPVGEDGLSFGDTRGDVIVEFLIENTIAVDGPCYLELGTLEETAQIDINFQQGLSVGAALRQLVQTGTLDVELEPIFDPVAKPGICARLHVYVQKGEEQHDAVFSWDAGRQVVGISDLLDGDQMANHIQFWNGQGGVAPGEDTPAPAIDAVSQARYGVWSEVRFFPGQTKAVAIEAFAELALSLRTQGRRTVTITPAPLVAPIPLIDYSPGDRVPVFASRRLRQEIPWSGEPVYQRVYGIPITIGVDGVERVDQLLASPDGFS